MRSNCFNASLCLPVLVTSVALLLGSTAASGQQQQINLSAGPTSTILPDGQTVPMWGYACGAPVSGSLAACSALNHAAAGWSPVLISVPTGQSLQINLSNNLVFGPNGVPTSIVIVGQLGGGLGTTATKVASPAHSTQNTTWQIAASGPQFTPPNQPKRVQSFTTEVAPAAVGSGTPVSLVWNGLKPGTYLIESGTHPSIQGPMGLYGVLVVTTPAASGGAQGTAYPGVAYDADVPMLLSEIDPVQNTAVNRAVNTSGFSETTVWSGQAGGCGNPSSATFGTCYPPAVNYDPRYYLINGVSLDKANLANSTIPVTAPASSGQILVRFVNAGLRMHVPSIVFQTQTSSSAAVTSSANTGFALIAEDGNPLPGASRTQSEVFLAAGKTYDVMIKAPASPAVLPVFDRQLSLSTNNQRDGGMRAFINVNGAALPVIGGTPGASATSQTYYCTPGATLTVSDPSKGVLANAVNAYGVTLGALTLVNSGDSLNLQADGTFVYTQATGNIKCGATFTYKLNGSSAATATGTANIVQCQANNPCFGGPPTANPDAYTSAVATRLQIAPPGVLANDVDPQGHPMTAQIDACVATPGSTCLASNQISLNPDGSFVATPGSSGTYTFSYHAVNSQNTPSSPTTVTLTFEPGSGLVVNVKDAPTGAAITDYRWIIEEDRTVTIDPNQTTSTSPTPVANLGTNFHSSYMPVVAAGCVGAVACEAGQTFLDPVSNSHQPGVCDIGNGACRTSATQQTAIDPKEVHLDPAKRYYISILPGDAGNSFGSGAGAPVPVNPNNPNGPKRPFSISQDCGAYNDSTKAANWAAGAGTCGHGMGGAPLAAGQSTVNVQLEETPFPTAKIAVFVFEDDSPLNGENDVHGGTDTFGTAREPGLGGFEVRLFDDAGGPGQATGQMTYDMFNMPLSNSLAGTIDQMTGLNACPITANPDGIVGMIVTCPRYESDGKTVSPLVGQAVIANMMPGRYGVQATPGADRIGRGEEWLQTNTLDGQKAHDAFIKVGGPAYFQEFGPAGFHVSIGFANPKIINARLPDVCKTAGTNCNNTVSGTVTGMHQSRTPDQRLYSSGTRDELGFTQCYVSLGDPDDDDIAFTKCNADGTFTLSGIPDGNWRITIFDQWNDQIVDGLSTPVALSGGKAVNMQIPAQQWHTNLYTRTFFDIDGNGVSNLDLSGTPCTAPNTPTGCNPNYGSSTEPGLALVPINNRFRDGSYSNFNNTDLNGFAAYNEIFPLFNWYVLEADTTRYKQTGVHVVYDAGGPVDGNGGGPGGTSSNIAANRANTAETFHLPNTLRFPGSVYCANADCTDIPTGIKAGPSASAATPSTGRIDPPWVTTEAWQGFIGENEFIEFGKKPFSSGENGGIHGEVVYASTRPFDDPTLLVHTSWTPNVPGVTVNLYQEGTAADGTQSLKLVDTTVTSSWDAWAQGFRSDGNPYMNCPGQDPSSLYFFTLKNSTQALDPDTPLPNNSQFKCYDGLSNFNQVQPAPYDGMYKFPSVVSRDPVTGQESGTNCTICVNNPTGDGTKMLPTGKYVVEIIVPPGYELVKEEDKNILIGDNYIAPVTQQFGSFGSIFILPDQADVASTYNPNNPQNPTGNLGVTTVPLSEGNPAGAEEFWPCVGQARVVPDYLSLFAHVKQVAPFAGETRHLCDRKEVTLTDQSAARAKFWIFSSTHVAAHYTGIMLDDLSSEFDPFSPQFGEKFAIPNVPVSFKDQNGLEVSRTYSDQWGMFNGLNYSTWEVNPPNPTGYAPTMMVACMNDPGPIPGPNGTMITDPQYNPNYSQFCYEIPFMPGQTQYMDTPVVPTAAFAEGYNLPDCAYPDATPAISSVTGDASGGGAGPWVIAAGHTLTISALGDQRVPNNAYSGPSATTAPYNNKFISRHYGFGPPPSAACNAGSSSTLACPNVTIGGAPLTGVTWTDSQITGKVPSLAAAQSTCTLPQQGVSSAIQCGELVITAANGKQSIDTVTVTIGGKPPSYVAGENPANNAIQKAIDAAAPGDLIMVGPGTYNEMLLMWKPVRLQGVGAASVTVNANTHPSGKMDAWRNQVACLFGLALNGGNISSKNPFDPSGATTCAFVTPTGASVPQVDPIPLEPIVGWDPTLNGNVAELLQEPTLMGAYEGAAITVLGKGTRGVTVNGVQQYDPNCTANGVCTPLTNSTADCTNYPSNFLCNPSRIDGMTFVNSSQGGGGIFLHGWNHFTEVSNNRVRSNAGTLSGGITVGQPENPDGTIVGTQMAAFGFDKNVNVHHNSVTQNTAYGDELNSTTPEAAGGVSFCTGSDSYKFNNNWVCGNLSTGDGGGFVHFGLSYNATISKNWFLFNQSNNITIPTHGGAIAILGAPPDGTVCENALVDMDCPPELSDGTGPGLLIDSNLIVGNTAESGSGGGIRLQGVNGTEVARNPLNPGAWYDVTLTNNMIVNNVAGWDGGGVSMQDALRVKFVNNTVVSNDTTASSGVLFNTLGAPNANTPPPTNGGGNCDPSTNPTCSGNQIVTSTRQPAGLVTMQNTPNLDASLPALIFCPIGNSSGLGIIFPIPNGDCRKISYPSLQNNIFWQNRAFNIQVGGLGTGPLSQQNLVTLLPQLNQTATGQCVNGAQYWDIGVRGDTAPSNHSSGFTLTPVYSVLTDASDYSSVLAHNFGSNPMLTRQYCNGSRVPPENGGLGYQVPPGIADATTPNPVFNLTPAATVDEGNNWINLAFGPLSLTNPLGGTLGNYATSPGSPAINAANSATAPNHDFFGTPRPQGAGYDIGATEVVIPNGAVASVTGGPLDFGNWGNGATSSALTLTLHNAGSANITGITLTFSAGARFSRPAGAGGGTCGATLTPATGSCTINVVFSPNGLTSFSSTLTITASVQVTGSPVTLTGTGVTPGTVSISPNPLTIMLPTGVTTGTGTVTLTNSSASGAQIAVGNVTVAGGNIFSYFFNAVVGADTCSGATLAPGGTCTVGVRFTNITSPRGVNRAGSIRFTDNATGSPQIGNLVGHAN
jgi:Bacterial cadherin-like domain